MKYSRLLFVIGVLSLALTGCARQRGGERDNTGARFEHGMAAFERGRWTKAAEDFNWVVLNNPAGSLAAEAQYYYAECLYQQKQYIEAQIEYESLLRRWASTQYLIEARYRIVQCLVAQSPAYYYDQKATIAAIDELQAFIDDFPASEQSKEAEQLITQLRHKMARKYYESGRLYLKWQRPEPARLYFDMVLTQYYDTQYADEARIGVVVSYIIGEDVDAAETYLEENAPRFSNNDLLAEAQRFIKMARAGKFDLGFYIRLYQ